jgi:hypothetical protein
MVAVVCGVMAGSATVRANVNLECRPALQLVGTGDEVAIGLFAVSDSGGDQAFLAVQIILAWDAAYVQLIGSDTIDAVAWSSSGFMPDPFGLNEADPPGDGDGIFVGLADPNTPLVATPDGVLLVTLEFQALQEVPDAYLDLPASGGLPLTHTVVFGADSPNQDITGELSGAEVRIDNCPSDLSGDEVVGLSDLAILLSNYPTPSGAGLLDGDLDADGDVDLADLAVLLSAYGTPCD